MTTPNVLMSNPLADTQLTPSSGAQSGPSNELNANAFITLLTAQLQSQDPFNPIDPTQMVNQLTQINSLQELIQIRTDLAQLVKVASTATPPSTTPLPTAGPAPLTPVSQK
jgi:flagellar basal-body rod modification protein FlgD